MVIAQLRYSLNMPSISHMLWFDDQAEDAANLYISIFKDGQIKNISNGSDGKVFTVDFELLGENYIALNGGPTFTFSEAFSIFVRVDGQEEVDFYWNALLADGGQAGRCGWLKDKYGFSWQIVPSIMDEMLSDKDEAKVARVTQAFLKMKKFDIGALKRAFNGE